MKANQVAEILYKVYQNGRPKSTDMRVRQSDILQMVLLSYGNLIRKRYYESKKLTEGGEPDYSFTSPILDVKEFPLAEANAFNNMRRIDMGEFDLVRLPNNGHITRVFPIGGTCGSSEMDAITPIKNGEEFYYAKPKFHNHKFYVVSGRGLNVYNLPPCATKLGVETTYSSGDIDISLDIAYDVSIAVFQILWKEKMFPVRVIDNSYDPNALDIKHRLAEEQSNL